MGSILTRGARLRATGRSLFVSPGCITRAWLEKATLTETELKLFANLPRPPLMADVQATNIWIVEWLPEDEQLTGRLLHDWMKNRRSGWSAYFRCGNKAEVIQAIERATVRAQRKEMIPVLHLESRGGPRNLGSGISGQSAPENGPVARESGAKSEQKVPT